MESDPQQQPDDVDYTGCEERKEFDFEDPGNYLIKTNGGPNAVGRYSG